MKKYHIAALLLALALLLPSLPARAGEYVAATVSNEDWMAYYGRSENRQEAIEQAVRACGGTSFCRDEVEVVSSGECIALVDAEESVSVAWGRGPQKAIADALGRCHENNRTNCRFVSMECAR
jgi:hypothetical protein